MTKILAVASIATLLVVSFYSYKSLEYQRRLYPATREATCAVRFDSEIAQGEDVESWVHNPVTDRCEITYNKGWLPTTRKDLDNCDLMKDLKLKEMPETSSHLDKMPIYKEYALCYLGQYYKEY